MDTKVLPIDFSNEAQIRGMFNQLPPVQYADLHAARGNSLLTPKFLAAISFTNACQKLAAPFDVTPLVLSRQVGRLALIENHASTRALADTLNTRIGNFLTVGAYVGSEINLTEGDNLMRALVPGLSSFLAERQLLVGATGFLMHFRYPQG